MHQIWQSSSSIHNIRGGRTKGPACVDAKIVIFKDGNNSKSSFSLFSFLKSKQFTIIVSMEGSPRSDPIKKFLSVNIRYTFKHSD